MVSSCCKQFSPLLRNNIKSCWICFLFKLSSFIQKRFHENVCKSNAYCYIEMSKEDSKVLKYNHGEKSVKNPFIFYADSECLLKKMSICYNNLERSSTTKNINIHLLVIQCLRIVHFIQQKNKLDCYRDKDCMERFCKDLKEHATKLIKYEKKEMILLTYKESKSYKKQKVGSWS